MFCLCKNNIRFVSLKTNHMKTKNKIFFSALALSVIAASALIIFLMHSLISQRPEEANKHATAVPEKSVNLNMESPIVAVPEEEVLEEPVDTLIGEVPVSIDSLDHV